jgi:hypothetical protein
LVGLSDEFGVEYDSLKAYYDAAGIAAKQTLATVFCKETYNCDFRDCTPPASTIEGALRPLLRLDEPADNNNNNSGNNDIAKRTIDLSFLADLGAATAPDGRGSVPFLRPNAVGSRRHAVHLWPAPRGRRRRARAAAKAPAQQPARGGPRRRKSCSRCAAEEFAA